MRLTRTVALLAAAGLLAGCGRSTAESARNDSKRAPAQRTTRWNARGREPTRAAVQEATESPTGYGTIAKDNLFRPLGWEESREHPFGLAGIVQHPDGPRALVTRQDRPAGLYVQVGGEVGDGYAVASIGGRSVRLVGDGVDDVTVEFDASVLGARGGDSPRRSRAQAQRKAEPQDGRWYPPSGMTLNELRAAIMDREGLTWAEVMADEDLGNAIEDKYRYLKDGGYVPDPED